MGRERRRDPRIVDLEGSEDTPEHLYWSWCQTEADIILLPYGSGLVRAALQGVPEDRLVFNHGGADDELARLFAPIVPAPASTYFTSLVELADQRGCASLTIGRGPGGFAATVSLGGLARAQELQLPAELIALTDWELSRIGPTGALLVVGRFDDDVALVRELDERPQLVGCVVAGIPAFGEALGEATDGVVGPAQWWPEETIPELGPSGVEFARQYEGRYDEQASYVAAQAAAGGWLAREAAEQSMTVDDVVEWSTSTLLGAFEVDEGGCQVAHQVPAVQWQQGAMKRVERAR